MARSCRSKMSALRSLMEAKRTTFAHFETYRFWTRSRHGPSRNPAAQQSPAVAFLPSEAREASGSETARLHRASSAVRRWRGRSQRVRSRPTVYAHDQRISKLQKGGIDCSAQKSAATISRSPAIVAISRFYSSLNRIQCKFVASCPLNGKRRIFRPGDNGSKYAVGGRFTPTSLLSVS